MLLPTAVCSNWGFWHNLKLVLCLEDWFYIYSFGLSNPQLQQATGVVRHCTRKRKKEEKLWEKQQTLSIENLEKTQEKQ